MSHPEPRHAVPSTPPAPSPARPRRQLPIDLLPRLAALILLCGLTGCAFFFGPKSRPASTAAFAPSDARLERGKYLVEHVSLCLHCHSRRSYEHFGMPPKKGTEGGGGDCFDDKQIEEIPGRLCMPNITPHPEAGIGKWTDGEIARAIREGVTREGKTVFPMMPYQFFRVMSDEDVAAIVVYLRTLAPIATVPAKTEMGFMVRRFVNFAPEPLDGPVAPPAAGDSVARGKYLTHIAGCVHCHTPLDGHDIDRKRLFAGGQEFKLKGGVHVNTPNLTPHATGVGKYSREQFIGRFKAFASLDPFAETMDWRKQTMMPWTEYAGMTEDDLGAIYDYLRTLPPIDNQVVAFPVPADGPKQDVRIRLAP